MRQIIAGCYDDSACGFPPWMMKHRFGGASISIGFPTTLERRVFGFFKICFGTFTVCINLHANFVCTLA